MDKDESERLKRLAQEVVEVMDKVAGTRTVPISPQNQLGEFKQIGSYLTFSWVCEMCNKTNKIDYSKWKYTNGLDDCVVCESAFIIKEPWKAYG